MSTTAPAVSHAKATATRPLAEHPHFTKLDAQLQPLPRSAKKHAAVYDARTGLIWSVAVVKAQNHAEAIELAKAHASLNSHDDWRLPERNELIALTDLARTQPAIDTEFFPKTPSDWHWTNTLFAGVPAYAWIVDFYYGHSNNYRRDHNDGFVRAVRGPVARPGQ